MIDQVTLSMIQQQMNMYALFSVINSNTPIQISTLGDSEIKFEASGYSI
jgi:hypothetical protein